ncbi:MAG: histidine--tRNA ligase, partial [Treponema sp.]|nr:histidine--tRNA ligase [Treponema sp.]
GKQYAVTEKKCIPWGILISREESESGKMTLKNLQTREQFSGLSAKEAAQKILDTNK